MTALKLFVFTVMEWGEDIKTISEDEAVMLVNHQATGDVCTLMMCLQDKGLVSHPEGRDRLHWNRTRSLYNWYIISNLVKLAPWPGNSCLFLLSFVPLKSTTETRSSARASIVARLRSSNGLGLKWFLLFKKVVSGSLTPGTPTQSTYTAPPTLRYFTLLSWGAQSQRSFFCNYFLLRMSIAISLVRGVKLSLLQLEKFGGPQSSGWMCIALF